MLKLPKEFYISELEREPYIREQLEIIKRNYSSDRSLSKPVTFALQYFAKYTTLVRNSGFSIDEARKIEDNYHTLYEVSTEYKNKRILEGAKQGYVVTAFGLRLRTPVMRQTVLGAKATPYEAEAEGRTAGNAMFQSYCMLNSRAANEFMEGVRTSEYKHDILACAQIHDASYYLIRADVKILKHVNDNLVKAAYWQELPEIKHPEVTLGGTLGVFHPSWEKEHEVPKYASIEELLEFGEEVVNAT